MRHRMRECVLKSSLLNLFLISLSLCLSTFLLPCLPPCLPLFLFLHSCLHAGIMLRLRVCRVMVIERQEQRQKRRIVLVCRTCIFITAGPVTL